MVERSLAVLEERKLLILGGLKGKPVASISKFQDVSMANWDLTKSRDAIEHTFEVSPECRIFGSLRSLLNDDEQSAATATERLS